MRTIITMALVASLGYGCQEIAPVESSEAAITETGPLTELTQVFRGSSFTVGVGNGTSKSIHNFLARASTDVATGKQRYAFVQVMLEAKTHPDRRPVDGQPPPPFEPDLRCPKFCGERNQTDPAKGCKPAGSCECKYGVDLVSMTWVQTFVDGSAFTGAIVKPDEQAQPLKYNSWRQNNVLCTNGTDFYLKAEGKITRGVGPRFEGLTGGTWELGSTEDSESTPARSVNNLTSGTFHADFVY